MLAIVVIFDVCEPSLVELLYGSYLEQDLSCNIIVIWRSFNLALILSHLSAEAL